MTRIKFKQLGLAGMFVAIGTFAAPCGIAQAVEPSQQNAADASTGELDVHAVQRVQDALHADPYFYDQHVTVSIEKGRVVLRGFVFSDWDLHTALRIARNAASSMRIVDDLTIKQSGLR